MPLTTEVPETSNNLYVTADLAETPQNMSQLEKSFQELKKMRQKTAASIQPWIELKMSKSWFVKEIRGGEFPCAADYECWADSLQKVLTPLSQRGNSNGKQFHAPYRPLSPAREWISTAQRTRHYQTGSWSSEALNLMLNIKHLSCSINSHICANQIWPSTKNNWNNL